MRPVELPQDEFMHQEMRYEWWYYTAFLELRGSHQRFHYVAAFMRWRSAWASYMCWRPSDGNESLHRMRYIDAPEVRHGERLVLQRPGQPEWSVTLGRIGYSEHRIGPLAALSFRPTGAAALHTAKERGGIRDYGGGHFMAWYSRPSIEVVGRLVGSHSQWDLTGVGWFEHQWGDTDARHITWRYIPILLDDGRRLIAVSHGYRDVWDARTMDVAVLANGYAQVLPAHVMTPDGPGGYITTIEGPNAQLTIRSKPGLIHLGVPGIDTFFEGESVVTGFLDGQKVTGNAVTEFHPA